MILVDTGFWVALLDRNDCNHANAVNCLKGITEPLVSTTPVITETTYLLLSKLGWPTVVRFMASIDNGLTSLFEMKLDHFERIAYLMKKYRELPMDFADASLIILAESIGEGRILSTDRRDFQAYRWKERKPFQNLLMSP